MKNLEPEIIDYTYADSETVYEINEIVKEYKASHVISYARDDCYIEAGNFYFYIQDKYPLLLNEVIEGKHFITYPVKLPLDLGDLKRDEYKEFIKKYPMKEIRKMGKKKLSQTVYDFIVDYHNEIPDDLMYMNHAWNMVDNVVIDLTYKQFENAVDSLSIDNYVE